MISHQAAQKKVLVLLDAHAILHRSYHALPSFTSPSGEPTGGVYGFTSMILKIIRELKPDYLVACYDLPEPTFRHIAYKGYKASRPKADSELISQIKKSREVTEVLKIPICEFPGFEADDILGTIVEKIKNEKGLKTVIASGDLDTLQLVKNSDVIVYVLSKGSEAVFYDEEAVKNRYGFLPDLVPDFKGLKGDPSDNIVGIKGIGDKTAAELIIRFGALENLYDKIKEDEAEILAAGIKMRVLQLLKENEEEALFSKALAVIRRDAPISFSLKDSAWQDGFDKEKAVFLFEKLGFKSLISRLPASPAGEANSN